MQSRSALLPIRFYAIIVRLRCISLALSLRAMRNILNMHTNNGANIHLGIYLRAAKSVMRKIFVMLIHLFVHPFIIFSFSPFRFHFPPRSWRERENEERNARFAWHSFLNCNQDNVLVTSPAFVANGGAKMLSHNRFDSELRLPFVARLFGRNSCMREGQETSMIIMRIRGVCVTHSAF